VQKHYNSANEELKANLENALEYLICLERSEWIRPRAHRMTKCDEFRDFFEIRFKANNVQQRPIGYFGPGANDFTILIWATEKGNKLIPEEWCSIANRRRLEIIEGKAKAEKLKFSHE